MEERERDTDRPVTGSVSVYSDSDDSDSFGDTDLFSRASHFQHQPRSFGGHRGGQGGHRGYPGPHPPFMFPPPPPGPPPQDSELYITCKSWCLFQTKVTMTFRFLFNLRHGLANANRQWPPILDPTKLDTRPDGSFYLEIQTM